MKGANTGCEDTKAQCKGYKSRVQRVQGQGTRGTKLRHEGSKGWAQKQGATAGYKGRVQRMPME